MTPPPPLRHLLLFAFIFILDFDLYGVPIPTVVASESVDISNGANNEQILVDIVPTSPDKLETYPWQHTNTTTPPTPTPSPPSNSCIAQTSCENCNSYSCHWCAFDNQCHAKGSIHGCAIGTNCHPKNDTKPDHDDPVDKTCQSHLSCTDCVLSSNLCHWCAFDDACHAIGSWYGCAHGTDCYANDRCQRRTPDAMDVSMFADIGFLPIVLIASIGVCSLFCSAVVYSGAKALTGAYQDLADATEPRRMEDLPGVSVERDYSAEVRLLSEEGEEEVVDHQVAKADVDVDSNALPSGSSEAIEANTTIDSESQSLLQETPHTPIVTAHPDPSRMPPRRIGRIGSQNITCLMKVCQAWYVFTIIGTIVFVTLSFYCFPRMPQYNVCSDEMAWKSIISGLTSLKMEASFELLLSIQNKNHLNIDLDGFAGKISHDGGEVGSFELPQSTIVASSITDVLVTCTVVPNKWEALGLIADYYKGELILTMSVNGAVKVSGIDYSFPVKETDVVVRVNDPSMDDRHLCVCPEWKDMYPTISPIPEFLVDSDSKPAVTIF